jgi:hypothetical protein
VLAAALLGLRGAWNQSAGRVGGWDNDLHGHHAARLAAGWTGDVGLENGFNPSHGVLQFLGLLRGEGRNRQFNNGIDLVRVMRYDQSSQPTDLTLVIAARPHFKTPAIQFEHLLATGAL